MKTFLLILNKTSLPICLMAILRINSAYSQASFVQDARGESSVMSPGGSGIVFNTSDAAISISFLKAKSSSPFYWGIDAKFKAEEGISLVVKNGNINPTGKVGGVFVWESKPNKGKWNNFYLSPAVSFSSSKLFDDQTNLFADQIAKKQFTAVSLKAAFNRTSHRKLFCSECESSPTILGISGTIGTTTNLGNLTKLDVITYTILKDESGQERKLETGQTSAFSPLSKYQDNLGYAQINVDWIIFPMVFQSRAAIAIFSRSKFANKMLPTHSPGAGIFLTKEGSPTDIVGGIVTQITDVFNVNDQPNGPKNRIVLSLVAGYSF
ncbi:hypothetical protein [Dyadobacter sp. OTU695]|uniref:hypothetical protein n=1 Tax=Dyadobacter sp. OTU695 TaxID=3043860 RepID=UPI00313BA9C9